MLEATNLSVGRGTDAPFEVVGAPWIEPYGLVAALNDQQLPGVRFEPVVFTPTNDRYANTQCFGVRLVVTDREAIRPVTVGLALGRALRERHREQFRAEAHPAPPGEPVHDLGLPAGGVAATSDGLGGDGARELPESAGVIPHLLI